MDRRPDTACKYLLLSSSEMVPSDGQGCGQRKHNRRECYAEVEPRWVQRTPAAGPDTGLSN